MDQVAVRAGAFAPGSQHHVLALIRSGVAQTRAELARVTGLAPSTVSTRVDELISGGILEEAGDGRSTGGRRPRVLRIRADAGTVAAVDLGANHAVVALLDLSGDIITQRTFPLDIAAGPDRVLTEAAENVRALVEALPPTQRLLGVAVGVPGPVRAGTGTVESPSRMPGWNQVDVGALMSSLVGVPVLVDNDSNLMAVGEFTMRVSDAPNMIMLKAGTGIGCGVIASGRLHHGANGAAGDISHVRVTGGSDVICSCGRVGCLDAVASGAALVRELHREGHEVADASEIVRRARDADPAVARVLRHAGRMTGEVLATTINFFNPNALVIGGQLGLAEPFVAAIRSAIYELCLPMAVKELTIDVSRAGSAAGVLGGGHLMLDQLFAESDEDGSARIAR
jgi:predicted NBD/HSP70 family sugar kinase